MPLYDYNCSGCGDFELMRGVEQAGMRVSCPACGDQARRLFTAPSLRRGSSAARAAVLREEQSRHEPLRVAEPTGRRLPHSHAPSRPWMVGH